MAEIVIDIRSNNATSRLSSLRTEFERTDRSINNTTQSVGRLNKGIISLVGAIGGLYGVKSAFDSIQTGFKTLESASLEVSKTTGLVGDDLKRLTDELDKMSTTMGGFEVRGLYSIAESAGQLGIQGVEDLKTFTKEMQYMASSSKLTAEEASTGFAEIANSLNLPIKDINKLTSSFSKLASTTTADEVKLLDFSQRLAGAGKTLGLTNAQIVGVGATMKDVGVTAEVGGTAMSAVFQKMLKNTESFATVSGVAFSDYSKMIDEKPVKALELFLESLGKLDKRARVEVLDSMKMSGSGLSSTLLKLSSNTEKLKANIETSTKAYEYGKATEDEYRVASESLANQQTKTESAILLVKKAIGDELKPMMVSLNDSTVNAIKWSQENSDTLKMLAVSVGIATTAYYGLKKAQQLQTVWAVGEGAIGLLGQIARMNQLQRSLALATASQQALNLTMRATPWGLAITGATLLGTALYNMYQIDKKRSAITADIKAKIDAGTHSLNEYGVIEENSKIRLKTYNKELERQKQLKAQIETLSKNTVLPEKVKNEALKNLGKEYNNISLQVQAMQDTYKKELPIIKTNTKVKLDGNLKVKNSSNEILKQLEELGKSGKKNTSTVSKSTKKLSSAQKEYNKFLKDSKRALEEFNDKYNKTFLTQFDYQKTQLDSQLANYQKYNIDKVRLDKWYSKELAKIEKTRLEKTIDLEQQSLQIKRLSLQLSTGKEDKLGSIKEDKLGSIDDSLTILREKLNIETDVAKQESIVVDILQKQIEKQKTLKDLEKTRLEKELSDKTKSFIENKRQQELYNKWLEKQSKNLSSRINGYLSGAFNNGITSDSINKIVANINGADFSSLTKNLSDAIASGAKKGTNSKDFKDATLKVTENLLGMYTQNVANQNQQTAHQRDSVAIGTAIGTAIGAYYGGELGASIGSALGATVGSAIGGSGRKEYVSVGNSGKVNDFTITDGGMLGSDSTKISLDKSRQATQTYQNIIKGYGKILKDLDIITVDFDADLTVKKNTKYRTKDLYNDITKAFFDELVGYNQDYIDKLNSISHGVPSGFSELETKANELRASWQNFADATNVGVLDAVTSAKANVDQMTYSLKEYKLKDDVVALDQFRIDTLSEEKNKLEAIIGVSNITADNFDRVNTTLWETGKATPEVETAMSQLGQNLLNTGKEADSFSNTMLQMANSMRTAESSLSTYLATRGKEGVELARIKAGFADTAYQEALTKIGLDASTSIDDLQKQIDESRRGLSSSGGHNPYHHDTNPINDNILITNNKNVEDAIALGIANAEAQDAVQKAIADKAKQDERDAKAAAKDATKVAKDATKVAKDATKAFEKLGSFFDWHYTFKLDDLKVASYNLTKYQELHQKSLDKLGLKTLTATEYENKYAEALKGGLTQDQVKTWEDMGDTITNVWEAQKRYNDIIKEQVNNLKSFDTFNKKFGSDSLKSANIDLENAKESVHKILQTGENFVDGTINMEEYLKYFQNAIDNGFKNSNIDDWKTLGDNIQSVMEAQKAYNEVMQEQKDYLISLKEFNNTLGMDSLQKDLYSWEKAKDAVDSILSTGEGFVSGSIDMEHYLQYFQNAIDNGFKNSNIDDWKTLGNALKDATEAEKAYKDAIQAKIDAQTKARFAEVQDREKDVVSIYKLIDDKQKIIDDYNKAVEKDAKAKADALENYNKKVIDLTDSMFKSAIDSFENEIKKLKDIGLDSGASKREQLIAFNKNQAIMENMIATGNISTEDFKKTYDNLLGNADYLGNNIQNYLDGTNLKNSLIANLIEEQTKISTTDAKAFVEKEDYISSITTEMKDSVVKTEKYMDYLNGLVSTEDGVKRFNQDMAFDFAIANHLNAQQFAEIIKISSDGMATLAETEMTNNLLDTQKTLLEDEIGIFAKDSSILNLIEAVKSLDLSSTKSSDTYVTSISTVYSGGGKSTTTTTSDGATMVSDSFPTSTFSSETFTLPSYDIGGYTGTSSINVDGKGGFNAILHPNEYVIPAKGVPVIREGSNQSNQLLTSLLNEIKNLKEEVKDLKRVNIISAEENRKNRKINQESLNLKYATA